MQYQYEVNKKNYEDLASGRVLYNAPGTTSFPVRLASEIVQRCFEILQEKGNQGPYTLYDPCCGGAYLLTVIGILHGQRFAKLIASDIDHKVLKIASKNLALLSAEGLNVRKEQLTEYSNLYKKQSHAEALKSVETLEGMIRKSNMDTYCFQKDITEIDRINKECSHVNLIITDLPYGDLVSWKSDDPNPISRFFEQIYLIADPKSSVIAIIADKNQKIKHEKFKRLQNFKIGKRQVGLFEPI
ncbi:hypothetical protein AB6A23_14050 [Paenibacillus tarimensis]